MEQGSESLAAAAIEGLLEPQAEVETPEAPQEEESKAPEEEKPEEVKPEEIELDEDSTHLDVTFKGEDGANVTSKVSLNELKKGYMMQKDYSRKTAELAKQRETLTDESRKAVEAKTRELEQSLGMARQILVDTVSPELQNVDWISLATQDPAKYVELRAKADAVAAKVAALNQKEQEVKNARAAEFQQAQAKAIAESRAVLERDMPGWSDQKYQEVLKAGVENYGFRPEEVGQIIDARVIKMLSDAVQFRALEKAKPVVAKKVAVAPKVIKPGTPQTKADNDEAQLKEERSRLRKSGRIEDAATILERFI